MGKSRKKFTNKSTRDFIFEVLNLLDKGEERIAQKEDGNWKINEWLKKAILLSFKVRDSSMFSSGISNSRGGQYSWYDKVDLKPQAGLKMSGQREVLDQYLVRS